MKKIITILLLVMLVASMPMAMAETGTEDVVVKVTITNMDDYWQNSTITVTVDDVVVFDESLWSGNQSDVIGVTYTYTCPTCSNSSIDTSTIINAINAELAKQNTTVIFNETTFQAIVNNEVQASRADEQAWIENTWMKTQQDYENVSAERDEWKLEASRLQTDLNQYTGVNSIPTQLENKISDLEKTVWAAGLLILILCIVLVFFILMVVKPSMGRLLKRGGDN